MAKHYVKNKDLIEQILISKDASTATPELLEMFYQIARGLSLKFTYRVEEDREDCIQQGVIDAYMYFRGFDPQKSTNAFAYITQCIKNGMAKSHKVFYSPYFKHPGYVQVSLSKDFYSI